MATLVQRLERLEKQMKCLNPCVPNSDSTSIVEGNSVSIIYEVVTLNVSADFAYTLQNPQLIDKILIKPTAITTLKIGTTPGGEQVMLEDLLAANTYKSVNNDIIADTTPVFIYFTGINSNTTIKIYKRRL